jgi:hypothetical protein
MTFLRHVLSVTELITEIRISIIKHLNIYELKMIKYYTTTILRVLDCIVTILFGVNLVLWLF